MDAITPKPTKPLGGKAYGSIPHLPGSRLGPADHHCHPGQETICTTKPRRGDRIIVSEKLDGACMSVARIGDDIVPITRAGYHANDGAYEHLRAFAPFVAAQEEMFRAALKDGERICGEWLAMAHGTRYDPGHGGFAPFIAFDIIRDGKRILRDEMEPRLRNAGIKIAACLHDGPEPYTVADAMARLLGKGFHGALDEVEGAVWRVEREGRVDFLAKYVRPDKTDGCYLPNISGNDAIWNWTA